MAQVYTVNLLFCDGVIVVSSDDIIGLHLEVGSMNELKAELTYVGAYLLVNNHGLTKEDLSDVEIAVKLDRRQFSVLQEDIPPSENQKSFMNSTYELPQVSVLQV